MYVGSQSDAVLLKVKTKYDPLVIDKKAKLPIQDDMHPSAK
jgi:hypothetical protein